MINYDILARSTEHYERNGFKRIEAPWTVTPAISNITKPADLKEPDKFVLKSGKELVASAEQSFLYMYNKGFLPKGRFQAITPCFRNDDFDETHTKYFMKNELIVTDFDEEKWKDEVQSVIDKALVFFYRYLPKEHFRVWWETETSADIMFAGTELGSYGYRKGNFLSWIYGTGVAEPRLSGTMQRYKHLL